MSSSVKRRKITEEAPAKVAKKEKKTPKAEPVEEKSTSPEPEAEEPSREEADAPAAAEEKAVVKSFKDLVCTQSNKCYVYSS